MSKRKVLGIAISMLVCETLLLLSTVLNIFDIFPDKTVGRFLESIDTLVCILLCPIMAISGLIWFFYSHENAKFKATVIVILLAPTFYFMCVILYFFTIGQYQTSIHS
jgi:hypothetical protein